ncbi:MAG: [acyl-carrier-protein] S-malonyltransferase [Kribbellaceae bacterium]|jgi:[acyl-carrier-protein] S-malonyltransferase|nr:[acyl-carrier-protein] S-malonyltransferase [Kribbellaceae bacterium]
MKVIQHAPPAPAGVMAYLNGEPVPRALLDERLAALRAGDAACVLPRPDSREGRQLTRWVAQVVLTERLCVDELSRRGDAVPVGAAKSLDVSTAVAVGSITAAALAGSEPVRRVAALVSGDVRIPRAQLDYAADVLGEQPPADPDVPVQRWHAELLDSARLEAFARWLNAAMHERIRLVHGLEHPGDSTQPDNLHRH